VGFNRAERGAGCALILPITCERSDSDHAENTESVQLHGNTPAAFSSRAVPQSMLGQHPEQQKSQERFHDIRYNEKSLQKWDERGKRESVQEDEMAMAI